MVVVVVVVVQDEEEEDKKEEKEGTGVTRKRRTFAMGTKSSCHWRKRVGVGEADG